jgi:hypothetical protein
MPNALRIAKEMGYVETIPEAFPGIDNLLSHAIELQKITTPFTTLELHNTLVAKKSFAYAVPVDWFWTQTEALQSVFPKWEVSSLRMLSPTAQVLYASAHAMLQHGGSNTGLRWLYDLDRLLRVYRERLDWNLLLTQAKTFEWSSAVSAALSQTTALFDTPVPQNANDELSKHADRNMKRVATLKEQPATPTLQEYQKLKSLNWSGRFKLLLALVAPRPAYMRWRYGLTDSQSLSGYYVYRWWEILKDAARTIGLLGRKFIVQANPAPAGLELDRAPEKARNSLLSYQERK